MPGQVEERRAMRRDVAIRLITLHASLCTLSVAQIKRLSHCAAELATAQPLLGRQGNAFFFRAFFA